MAFATWFPLVLWLSDFLSLQAPSHRTGQIELFFVFLYLYLFLLHPIEYISCTISISTRLIKLRVHNEKKKKIRMEKDTL